jgi:hypothetical protein
LSTRSNKYIHNIYKLPSIEPTSDIFMQRWVSPLRDHGSGLYSRATTTLGL